LQYLQNQLKPEISDILVGYGNCKKKGSEMTITITKERGDPLPKQRQM
jgi:hypothetical protein